MKIFQDYAKYYNIFYKDKDYTKEAENAELLFKRWDTGKQISILNLGCGTGKHDIAFAKLGYSVTGIDISPQMVEAAQKNNTRSQYDIEYEVADIRNYTAGKTYDVATSLFHVISYQNKNKDILGTFHTAAKALRQNGIFIFDFWYGPGVLSDRPSVRIKTADDAGHAIYRIANPQMHAQENIVDVNYKIFVVEKETGYTKLVEETHKMRYYFVPELKAYLETAGFQMLECLDCTTLKKAEFDSWTAICAAKKL